MSNHKKILVYAHWIGMETPSLMGLLYSTLSKGKEIFSFEYDKDWLSSGATQMLDPHLQLFSGRFYPKEDQQNFGVFLDSSPDRWGRVLMQRKEGLSARKENRAPRSLSESDFLLGVYDGYRMGALRFKLEENGNFLNDDTLFAAPPFTSLGELETASRNFEEDNDDENDAKWINILIAPGASLGGARPKASVIDNKNQLWIAKFPSINDRKNVGAWELVAYELAKRAGLNIAPSEIRKFNSHHHTFLTKRFDRNISGQRTHFASAMTVLGYRDGEGSENGISYLELAEFIIRHGNEVNKDLEELWRRIVFYISIKNTDDHLRNHGFLLTPDGWKLSPAYDINPNEYGTGLSLNITETDNALEYDLAISVKDMFRISDTTAVEIIRTVKNTIRNWKQLAKNAEIPNAEIDRMSQAFVSDK